ncbi:MAG: hypothetical protein WD830_02100 [Chloroflexota bacterium]
MEIGFRLSRRGHGVHAALGDRRRYERQIDRLHQRHLFDGGLYRLTDGEVNLATVVMHRGHVARLLARTVQAGEYRLRPATVRTIVVQGRKRQVFDYPLLDLVIHGVVAEILTEAVEPVLSTCVYSYRHGVSSMDGVSALARFVREHRRSRPDPLTRGLYVLRRDVDSYTDSIPLGATSPLWDQVDQAIRSRGAPLPTSADRELIDEVIRPTVLTDDGFAASRVHGVATGQPISCVCFNLYLCELDRRAGATPGAFYARYSDDLVFAHPDADVARRVSEALDAGIAAVGLRFNDEKRRDLYMTGSGRPSAEWPEARGTTSVAFVGMRVTMDGTVALGPRKVRGLLRDARRRAANTADALADADAARRGHAVADVVNALLDRDDPQLHGAAVPLLTHAVTDRRQLEELDHQLARIVSSAATGVRGPAAFQKAPYRVVRGEWGLTSLRRARDRSPSRATRTRPRGTA